MKVGDYIKKVRISLGMDQSEFAELFETRRYKISSLENGSRNYFDLTYRIILFGRFNITTEDIDTLIAYFLDDETYTEYLIRRKDELDLSCADISEMLNMSRSMISKYTIGRIEITKDKLLMMLLGFEFDINVMDIIIQVEEGIDDRYNPILIPIDNIYNLVNSESGYVSDNHRMTIS